MKVRIEKKRKGDGKTVKHQRYDSWFEFVEHGRNRVPACDVQSSRSTSSPEWCHSANFEECVELAENGWPEGAAKVSAITSAMLNRITMLIERPQVEYCVTGNDFDVALVNQGIPECWTRITHEEIQSGIGTKVLKLTYNCSTSAGISFETMIAKGAAVCALVESLEYAGFRVDVEMVHSVAWHNGKNAAESNHYVPVKEANQQVDSDKLAFALAHPSTLRRLIFAVQEEDKVFMKHESFGYGMPSDIPKDEQGDIYIGSALLGEPHWTNQAETIKWVLAQLEAQGVSLTSQVPA